MPYWLPFWARVWDKALDPGLCTRSLALKLFHRAHSGEHTLAASMAGLSLLLCRLEEHPDLASTLTLPAIVQFIVHAFALKDNILLTQPASHDPNTIPEHLSVSVKEYLASVANVTVDQVVVRWAISREITWDTNEVKRMFEGKEDAFRSHGWIRGISTLCAVNEMNLPPYDNSWCHAVCHPSLHSSTLWCVLFRTMYAALVHFMVPKQRVRRDSLNPSQKTLLAKSGKGRRAPGG